MEHQEIIDQFRAALARANTLGTLDAIVDHAWGLLPADAALANTIVIQEVAKRREELRRK